MNEKITLLINPIKREFIGKFSMTSALLKKFKEEHLLKKDIPGLFPELIKGEARIKKNKSEEHYTVHFYVEDENEIIETEPDFELYIAKDSTYIEKQTAEEIVLNF